jgi:hypothetical protein
MLYLSYVWEIISKSYAMVAITITNMLVLYCFLRPRFQWWIYPTMVAITYLSLPLVYKLSTELFGEPINYSALLACIGYWGNIMVLICFREHIQKMIFLLFTLQIINRLFTFCGYMLQIFLGTILGVRMDAQLSITLVIISLYLVISLMCWLSLRKKGRELIQAKSHRHYWVVLASIAVSAKLIIDFCSDYAFTLNPYSDSKIILAMIVLIIFVLAVLVLYLYSTLTTLKHLELKTSADRLNFEKEAQQRYYETQLHNQEELRRMKHDMNGNLNTILGLLSDNMNDEALQYLTKLCNYSNRNQKVLYCDDPYLNAVVTNFATIFAENDIPFEQEISLGRVEPHQVEMCLALNNALQNALEASLNLLPERRYVKLQIRTKQSRLLLRITNHFNSELIFKGELPCSTKEGDGHGYGLTSIRNAAESVGGFLRCTTEGNMFVLDVAM